MYAIVATGGKQLKVEKGQTVKIERVSEPGSTIDLRPVLLVDGEKVLSTPSELSKATVSAKVLEETKGKKLEGFIYKNKSNNRRRFGHRQIYSTVEITKIAKTGGKTAAEKVDSAEKPAATKKAATKKTTAKPAAEKKAATKKPAAAKKEAAPKKAASTKEEE